MANRKQHLTELAENIKAKKFINEYAKDNDGKMPSIEDVEDAQKLTPEEEAKIDFMVEAAELTDMAEAKQETPEWDYIVDEASWNASYANGALKDYYVWADSIQPYKEDLWNEADQRPANWNDIVKEGGKPVEFPDGYHYVDRLGNPCVRCWKGAFYAPGAAYPWAAVKFQPFYGTIREEYEGVEKAPFGTSFKQFKRTFAIESIVTMFGNEYKSDFNGNTSFDSSKLHITLFKEQ